MLRANPIRSSWDQEKGKHHRHDVVMAAKRRLKETEPDRTRWPAEADLVQEAGLAWLAQRAERCGFTFAPGEVLADGYRQQVFKKTQVARPIQISTNRLHGDTDRDRARGVPRSAPGGIGPAKGFGCGLSWPAGVRGGDASPSPTHHQSRSGCPRLVFIERGEIDVLTAPSWWSTRTASAPTSPSAAWPA